MIAVIFEVEPVEDCEAAYLAQASALKEELEAIPGFVSVERFRSIADPAKLLSLSFFRDEAAVDEWRGGIFTGYRLRVPEVLRDYGLDDRDEVPD
jgi:heme-degrading monooxygenase HmoA